MRAASGSTSLSLAYAETTHAIASQAASLDLHYSSTDIDTTGRRDEAAPEAFGDVAVHLAPLKTKKPAGHGNRASVSFSARYEYPVL
jgi:hypothetical protein